MGRRGERALAIALLFAVPALAACGGLARTDDEVWVPADYGSEVDTVETVEGGLRYARVTGYLGHPMRAELESDGEVCPSPWSATAVRIEGNLPPGLSLIPRTGEIEGIPEATGTWEARVLLEDVACGDLRADSLAVPVTIAVETFRPDREAILPEPPPAAPRHPREPPGDEDDDGVGDLVDGCPRTAPGVVVDTAGCAIDSDGDQVPDGLDACPATPRGVFVDVDGCPIDEDGP